MDASIKYEIIEKIVQTQDELILQEIKALLDSRQSADAIPEHHRLTLDQRLTEDDISGDAGSDWKTVLERIQPKP
jgi:hypothetical protein